MKIVDNKVIDNMVHLLALSQEQVFHKLNTSNFKFYNKEVVKFNNVIQGILFFPKFSNTYPMCCIHCDTINDSYNEVIKPNELMIGDNILSTYNTTKVLGADDRAGLYIALELMKEGIQVAFGFFRDEEVGAKGSNYVVSTRGDLFKDVNSFIGLDRRGYKEFAIYSTTSKRLNSFAENILGYKQVNGTFSDCSLLSDETMLPCINIAVGYYGEHTSQEILKLEEMLATVDDVRLLLSYINNEVFDDVVVVDYDDYLMRFNTEVTGNTDVTTMVVCDCCHCHLPLYETPYGYSLCGNCLGIDDSYEGYEGYDY